MATFKDKVVYKYATGQVIPYGAKYLCTQVELAEMVMVQNSAGSNTKRRKNELVWHYYEVQPESTSSKENP